jgi:ABC-type polysaccharide/polyol phosphate export permease
MGLPTPLVIGRMSGMTVNFQSAQHSSQLAFREDRLSKALVDLAQGLVQWRVWWILAFNDIRQRYRRSALGQFWLTISMAVNIAGIGLVFGLIFNQRLNNYIPFLGIGIVAWNLLSGLINELATSFIASDTHLRSYPAPRSVVVYARSRATYSSQVTIC